MEQLNLNLESDGIEQRSQPLLTTPFMVSLTMHLVLLLALSSYWVLGSQSKTIRLEAQSERPAELLDLSVQLELPVTEDLLESADQQLPELELLPETALELMPATDAPELSHFNPDLVSLGELTSQPKLGSAGSVGSSFFGIPPVGDRIVYIIDMSPSMQVGKYQRRFDRAVNEVLKSVEQLREDQEFFVIMFSFKTVKLRIGGNQEFCFATEENKQRLKKRLLSLDLSSGTDPREALVAALKLKPSCIFLLSDGEFNGVQLRNGMYRDKINAYQLSLKHNKNKCPIHTIGLEDPRTQQQLTQISEASGGTYVFVSAED